MKTLKTAEELYRKHRSDHTQSNIPSPMYFDSFAEAIADYKEELITEIEKMKTTLKILYDSIYLHYGENKKATIIKGKIEALIEVINLIKND
jgi:hypothetical protein